MICLKNESIDILIEKAGSSPRKRMNLNVHQSLDDKVHRFFNAMEPETYVRPHRHMQEGRFELFLCLRGKGAALTFDDSGSITDKAILSPGEGCIGIEVPPNTWHTIISLSPGTVFFEVKEGPYIAMSDKDFASWAPDPGDPGSHIYLQRLKEELICLA